MRLPPEGVQALRDLTDDPTVGVLPLKRKRGGQPGPRAKKEKPAKKDQLDWDALAPLIASGFTAKQMAKALSMNLPRFNALYSLATTDGKFDPDKAKLLSTATMANALFNVGLKGSMPAAWVRVKTLAPDKFFDRMPADPGKKIEKLSDDELEQLLLANPALRKKALEVEAKQKVPK